MSLLKNMLGLDGNIAKDLHSQGERYFLCCSKCGAKASCTQEEFERYLKTGWPKHCGMTMQLEKAA